MEQYTTPNFKKEMMQDYTILMPNMATTQWKCLQAARQTTT